MLALICASTADDRQAPDSKKLSRHLLSEGLVGVQARTHARTHAHSRARRHSRARTHRLRQMPKAGSAKDMLISLRGVFTSLLEPNDATTVQTEPPKLTEPPMALPAHTLPLRP